MLKRAIAHELSRSVRPACLWGLCGLALAVCARLHWFSLTDMPLFYLLFVSAAGYQLYRFWRISYGPEAEFTFAIPLSPAGQTGLRLLSMLAASAIAALAILLCLALQGEHVSALMRGQSLFAMLTLWFMLCWSMYLFCVQGAFCLVLAFQPIFRRLWPLAALAFFAAGSLLFRFSTDLMANALPAQLSLTAAGLTLSSASAQGPDYSFAFSLSGLLVNAITLPLAACLMTRLTRKYLLLG